MGGNEKFETISPGMPIHDELEVLSARRRQERERYHELTAQLFAAVRRAADQGKDVEFIASHAQLPTDTVKRHLDEHS